MKHIVSRKKNTASHSKTMLVSMLSLATLPGVASAAATDMLPTIQVTAESDGLKVDQSANNKYVAPLLDTPKSVAVISQKLIQETNSNTLLEALRNEPGITLGAGEGGTPYTDMPYIRGYSSQSSIYVDGVRNATTQNRDMFAIEQVEVTKGSSSAVSGGSGVGGSINLITKTAHEGDVLQGNVGNGTDDYQHIMLDGNKDFGNGVAGRAVIMAHHNNKPGQGSDGAEYSRFGIAPSIALGLGSNNRATLGYYFLKSNDEPDAGIPFNNPTNNIAAATYVGDGKPAAVPQGTYYGWKDRDFDKRENHIGTLKLEHDFNDNLTLSNTASYNYSKADYISSMPDDSQGNIYNGEVWRRNNNSVRDTKAFTDQLSLLGQLNTGFIKHNFNVGAEYNHQETNRGAYTVTDTVNGVNVNNGNAATGACSLGIGAASNYWCTSLRSPSSSDPWRGSAVANKDQTTVTSETTSIYALDSLELNKFWLLNLGIRWDQFNTELKYNQDVSGRGSTVVAGTTFESDTDYFSYQAGIVFKPVEQGSIYVSYATSANPVGIDQGDGSEGLSTTQQVNDLDPEKAQTYEIGTKWDILNKKANLTAAVFRTEKQNSRVTDSDGSSRNIGSSKVDGVELGATGHLTALWEVMAGYSYLDSELTKGNQNSAGLLTEGKSLPFVAKNSATLWTTYKVLPQLTLGAGAQYRDIVYANTTSPKILPAYTTYNAMGKYDVNRNVNLQINVNNISDKRYFTGAHAAHYANEADGRNAVLSLNFKY
ncbi:MAG: TonB-dependent siderophore receptor [Moraxellaceae bacterium]|nr:MAG: TonB-dependent siderophore receptor [Moraxellaceae bacterium]